MTVAEPQETVPLTTDEHGVIRVASTRVTLDTVVAAFDAGATPEEICQDFPTLELADVYAVLTYALRHRHEVDEYLAGRRTRAAQLRQEIEGSEANRKLRERLLAHRCG